MPKLPGISHRDAVRVFTKLGFQVKRQSGRIMMSDGKRILVIPRRNPINAIAMGGIAKSVGLTPDQFQKLF
jgi:predicted RNA binding protein YcfA (HicA-like mRNA interferase family)